MNYVVKEIFASLSEGLLIAQALKKFETRKSFNPQLLIYPQGIGTQELLVIIEGDIVEVRNQIKYQLYEKKMIDTRQTDFECLYRGNKITIHIDKENIDESLIANVVEYIYQSFDLVSSFAIGELYIYLKKGLEKFVKDPSKHDMYFITKQFKDFAEGKVSASTESLLEKHIKNYKTKEFGDIFNEIFELEVSGKFSQNEIDQMNDELLTFSKSEEFLGNKIIPMKGDLTYEIDTFLRHIQIRNAESFKNSPNEAHLLDYVLNKKGKVQVYDIEEIIKQYNFVYLQDEYNAIKESFLRSFSLGHTYDDTGTMTLLGIYGNGYAFSNLKVQYICIIGKTNTEIQNIIDGLEEKTVVLTNQKPYHSGLSDIVVISSTEFPGLYFTMSKDSTIGIDFSIDEMFEDFTCFSKTSGENARRNFYKDDILKILKNLHNNLHNNDDSIQVDVNEIRNGFLTNRAYSIDELSLIRDSVLGLDRYHEVDYDSN